MCFEVHDGLNDLGRDELDLVGDVSQIFERVEKRGRGGAQQIRGFTRDRVAVGELDRNSGAVGTLHHLTSGENYGALLRGDLGFIHQKLDFADFLRLCLSFGVGTGGLK